MSILHLRVAKLPAEFPVFPLTGALLLPNGKLPLNIFEPRYLAMVEDSLANGRMFGMIQPDYSQPCGATGPGLFRVGCLGRLASFSETEDGRYLITLIGIARFEVACELEGRRGYRRVAANWTRYTGDLDPVSRPAEIDREALTRQLRAYFSRRGIEANWDAITCMPNDTLITTLSMVCPFPPLEKQALLEADTDRDRCDALIALLQMDAGGANEGAVRTAS